MNFGLHVLGSSRHRAANPILISHTGSNDNGTGSSVTTPSINTIGSSLIVVVVGIDSLRPSGSAPVSDSLSNSWTALNPDEGINGNVQISYAWNPIVSSGHTFTAHDSGNNGTAVSVLAFSNTRILSDPFESQNSNHSMPAATVQPGSVTPNSSNDLIITAMGVYTAFAPSPVVSVDSGFTIPDTLGAAGSGPANAAWTAYLVAPNGNPVNPTFTSADSSRALSSVIAVFAHV